MLTRKSVEGLDPFLRHELVRSLLDDGRTEDVVIVVSTTPLLELGRDLDFDWAIVEPCTVQSAIQTAERVRRHRFDDWSAVNIGILSYASDLLLASEGRNVALAKPGLETGIAMGCRNDQALPLTSRAAADLFDLPTWATRLDAAEAVHPSCLAAQHAERSRAWCLLGLAEADDPVSNREALSLSVLAFAADPERMLDDCHPRERQFRRRRDKDVTYFRRRDSRGSAAWWRVEWDAKDATCTTECHPSEP